jgi:hypothetical protein
MSRSDLAWRVFRNAFKVLELERSYGLGVTTADALRLAATECRAAIDRVLEEVT